MSSKKETTTTATTVKRGRPVIAGSKRQAVLAMREAKRAQGIEIKRGRPKMVKDETVEVKVKTTKTPKARKVTNDTAAVEFTWDDVNGTK